MKKIILLAALLFGVSFIHAQGQANNWYFGNRAGIQFLPGGTVVPLNGSVMETNEGCSTISDQQGNLLFYTDGRTVWDRNHTVMPNGNYAGGNGLLGDPSSTQSGIIIPDKTNPNKYYIFTVDEPHHLNAGPNFPNPYTGVYEQGGTVPEADDGLNNGFNYSVVDLSVTGANGSIGDVVSRNNPLVTYDPASGEEIKYKCSEKVTAVTNSAGNGYWVITHFIDKFYAFLVDVNGVAQEPVITEIDPVVPISGYRRNAIGYIKASPDGKKLAIAHVQNSTVTGSEDTNGSAYLYNFNNTTGVVTNAVVISENTAPYGIEFSPASSKLYVSYDSNNAGYTGLHQYDLLSSNIAASDVFIGNTQNGGSALQLGPDGKIYKAIRQISGLDVINNPDETGTLCNYVPNALSLNGIAAFGLPPFITSLFAVNIITENTCFNGNPTQFSLNVIGTLDSVTWDFGDNSPASVTASPSHTYQAAGTYTVTATVVSNGNTEVFTQEITIAAVPVANPVANLAKCDDDNDGSVAFIFNDVTDDILNGQDSSIYNVRYFASQETANTGTAMLNSTSFTNLTNPQTIYARAENRQNPDCHDITSFEITALPTPDIVTQSTETACANGAITITLDAGTTLNTNEYTYQWSTGAVTPTINVTRPGTYTVTVRNQTDCEKVRTITVLPSELAVIASVDITDITDNNTVTVNTEGGNNNDFLYSLDKPDGPYQVLNFFDNVSAGIHTVYISNANGCGTVSEKISVLQVPKFFTPNGDFKHDTWNIIGINSLFYANSTIYIYDRYGKLLAGIDPKGRGWDGMYNGYPLPATDYWYVVTLDNGRIVKGHFSLIR